MAVIIPMDMQLARNSGVRVSSNSMEGDAVSGSRVCINDVLTDDSLRLIVGRVESRRKPRRSPHVRVEEWLIGSHAWSSWNTLSSLYVDPICHH